MLKIKRIAKTLLVSLVVLQLLYSCSKGITIVDQPIIFNEQRVELTKEYLQERYHLKGDSIIITPKMIVLHHTVIPTFKKTFEAFNNPTLANWRPDLKNVSGLNVSSQFVVDRDGTIYRLMPENYMARHVIGLNHCAIGIENVGGTKEHPLTKAQEKANIALVKYLAEKYPIEYLIGHREYMQFESHPLWLEVDPKYRTIKDDPSEDFLFAVRKATSHLNFKAIPN